MATQSLSCSNPDCNLDIDGKCVEGLEFEECPHVTQFSIDDIPESEEPERVSQVQVPAILLSPGEALDRPAASDLQRRLVSRVVGLIGPNDSGKTSLIAGVYELMQEKPVPGLTFAGSSTLVAFEKVCHLARVASRRAGPHTERTSRGVDATFFHLDYRQKGAGLVSLLIGDRSGEDYLATTDEISQAAAFFEIRRADCITLLVNGEHLVDKGLRHEARAATLQIVDALIEAQAIRKGCRLASVLTKKDAVVASPHAQRAEQDFDGLVASITGAHVDHLGEVRKFVVAASPKDIELVERGEGLIELLHFWLQADVFRALQDQPQAVFDRMIDVLTEKGPDQ